MAAGLAVALIQAVALIVMTSAPERFVLDVALVALLTAGATWWYLGRDGAFFWGLWALVGWLFAGFAAIGILLAIVGGEPIASIPVAGFYYALYTGVLFLGIPAAVLAILVADWRVGRAKKW